MASNFPPEGHIRLNANVPIELHQKLKMKRRCAKAGAKSPMRRNFGPAER